jgi:hypothetical protein
MLSATRWGLLPALIASLVESVSRWGQDLNVRQTAPTGKMSRFGVSERI